jgi:hypothetical protein
MDWYTVEYLYPDGFKKFTEKMFPYVGVVSLSTLEFYDIKKLYNFFDKEGIYLTIEMYNLNQWVFSISLQNGIVLGPNQSTKSNREDIEYDGFLECFKLLNKKLENV